MRAFFDYRLDSPIGLAYTTLYRGLGNPDGSRLRTASHPLFRRSQRRESQGPGMKALGCGYSSQDHRKPKGAESLVYLVVLQVDTDEIQGNTLDCGEFFSLSQF